MADARRQKNTDVFTRQLVPQFTEMDKAVHHLRDAETVTEVVERVVAVVLLDAQLDTETQTPPRHAITTNYTLTQNCSCVVC